MINTNTTLLTRKYIYTDFIKRTKHNKNIECPLLHNTHVQSAMAQNDCWRYDEPRDETYGVELLKTFIHIQENEKKKLNEPSLGIKHSNTPWKGFDYIKWTVNVYNGSFAYPTKV